MVILFGTLVWLQKSLVGYIPYRDINMIVNPLFFFLGAIFIKLLGNYGYAFHIYNGFIYGTTFMLMIIILRCLKVDKKLITPTFIIYFMISLILIVTNYNHLFVCLELIIFLVELLRITKKSKFIEKHANLTNILIGFLLICCFLTKQNMGCFIGFAYFAYLFIIEKSLKFKEKLFAFLYKCIGALLGLVPFIIYLTANHIWNDYLDMCYGGLSDFVVNNSKLMTYTIIILFFYVHIIYMYYLLYKQQKKEPYLLFILFSLANLLFLYPIFDLNHIITVLPLFYIGFVLLIHNNIYFADISFYRQKLLNNINPFIYVFVVIEIIIAPLFLIKNTTIPEKYNIYKGYLALDNHFFEKLETMNQYIDKKEEEGYTIFFLSPDATLYRWPLRDKWQ